MRQAGNNPYGLSTASQLPGQVAMADDTRVLRDFDPDGAWDPNAPESMGKDRGQLGQNTAQLVLVNPATMGGAVGGGYRPVRPNGAGGPPGYDIRTDMPTTTPGFSWADPSVGLGAPPLQGESPSWKDFMTGGLPLPARALVNALDSLVFKSPSDILGDNLQAGGQIRPDGSAAHHIVPYGDRRAADLRTTLGNLGIDINSPDNGVFLPQVPGSTAPGAYHPSLNSKAYHEQLGLDLLGVSSRQRALDILDNIRGQLLNGTYPGSKPTPPKP